MRNPPKDVPALYVEGADDISAVAALLKRHGYDTKRGRKHLFIAHAGDEGGESTGSDSELFDAMPDIVKGNPSQPCGFVFDIDIETAKRWNRVRRRLQSIVSDLIDFTEPLPAGCESLGKEGYIGHVKGYAKPFGVWLMPDCKSDGQKLEHLIESLIPADDAILRYARKCTASFPKVVSDANASSNGSALKLKCFTEKDRIKAEIRAWLAWQEEPGQPFGAAITRKYLSHDSQQAMAFLEWLSRLYGFKFPGPDVPS